MQPQTPSAVAIASRDAIKVEYLQALDQLASLTNQRNQCAARVEALRLKLELFDKFVEETAG